MESNQKHFSTLLFNSPSGSFLTDSEIQSAGFQRNSMSSQRKIFISDTQMKSNTFSKHILYLISGEDLNGKFTNFRRYKDFIRLHKRLINQWPGCFIPHLPPKKAIVTSI